MFWLKILLNILCLRKTVETLYQAVVSILPNSEMLKNNHWLTIQAAYCHPIFKFFVRQQPLAAVVIITTAKEEIRSSIQREKSV